MIKRFIGIFATLLLATSVFAQIGTRTWDFDSETVGGPLSGFTSIEGQWNVVADPSAPSRENALAQVAKNLGSTFNLVLANDTHYQDIDLSVNRSPVP